VVPTAGVLSTAKFDRVPDYDAGASPGRSTADGWSEETTDAIDDLRFSLARITVAAEG
jgi:hypothetical protein